MVAERLADLVPVSQLHASVLNHFCGHVSVGLDGVGGRLVTVPHGAAAGRYATEQRREVFVCGASGDAVAGKVAGQADFDCLGFVLKRPVPGCGGVTGVVDGVGVNGHRGGNGKVLC